MLFDSTKEPKFERHIVMRNTGTIRVVWYDSDPIVTPIVEIPDYPTLKTVQILAFFILSAGTMSSPPFTLSIHLNLKKGISKVFRLRHQLELPQNAHQYNDKNYDQKCGNSGRNFILCLYLKFIRSQFAYKNI